MYQTLQNSGVIGPGRPHNEVAPLSSDEARWVQEKRLVQTINAMVYKMDEIIDRLNALEERNEVE